MKKVLSTWCTQVKTRHRAFHSSGNIESRAVFVIVHEEHIYQTRPCRWNCASYEWITFRKTLTVYYCITH